jgi:hypothetical protein
LALSAWYHVAFTFDGSAITAFVSGKRETGPGPGSGISAARAGCYNLGGRGLTVGGGGGSDRSCQCRLADVRFYNKTILTDAEIMQNYLSAFQQPKDVLPMLPLPASGWNPAWARYANPPIIGTGIY